MNESHSHDEDREFERLFRTLENSVDGADFTSDIMRRIRRHMRMRRAVLAVAAAIGIAITLGPMSQLFDLTSDLLLGATMRWSVTLAAADYIPPIIVLIMILAWPGALRWLAR